jgi:hypothetical protein
MKLDLLSVVMYLFNLAAYPFVFVHGKRSQFARLRENIHPANSLVSGPVTPGRGTITKP